MKHPFSLVPAFHSASDVLDQDIIDRIVAIKQRVLERIKPSQQEIDEGKAITDEVCGAIRAALERVAPVDYVEPQGSTGIKQTQLAGDHDVDLFIGLDPSIVLQHGDMARKKVREILKHQFTKWIDDVLIPCARDDLAAEKIQFTYAEHPYLSITVRGMKFDVVFCINITSDEITAHNIVTAMDRTPLHSQFVRGNLSDEQRDDVRLFKAFLKAGHVYGDRAAPGQMGIVGYCTEILIHFFGSVETAMVNFAALETEPVDVHGRSKAEVAAMPRFGNDFAIVVDPTDPNRNVASSLDERTFRHAAHLIAAFLENPDASYFERLPIPDPPNDDPRFVAISVVNSQEVHYTVVRDKLYKIGEAVKRNLEQESTHEPMFGEIEYAVLLAKDDTAAALAFFVENPEIPIIFKRYGPAPDEERPRVAAFLDKHPDAALDETGKYFFLKEREETAFVPAAIKEVEKSFDIRGAQPARDASGLILAESDPADVLCRQVIHVLKTMVLPYINKA
jgi:tRNA nucleotidyltransferase (CCA-adding enzyme)